MWQSHNLMCMNCNMPYGVISLYHHNFIKETATCQVVEATKLDKWQGFGIGFYFNILYQYM